MLYYAFIYIFVTFKLLSIFYAQAAFKSHILSIIKK